MSLSMFIVGCVIFTAYLYFLIWNIFWSSKKQREENYPNLNGMGEDVDYDGMGNFSRFPTDTRKKTFRYRVNRSVKTKVK